jgi:hypothetical protein
MHYVQFEIYDYVSQLCNKKWHGKNAVLHEHTPLIYCKLWIWQISVIGWQIQLII